MRTILTWITAGTLLLGFAGATVRANETEPVIAQAMEKVCVAVMKILQDEGRKHEIIVGDISGMPNLKASGGVELARQLELALERAGIRVHDDADTQLMGTFNMIQDKAHPDHDFDSLAMKIHLKLMDEFGKELAEPEILVYGNQILQIAGINTHIPPQSTPKEKQQEIIRQFRKPDTGLTGNQVHAGGPFAIEVFVNNSGKLLSKVPSIDTKGRPFVPLHHGEEYVVRLHNHADFETAVTLVIDGVNVFVNSQDPGLKADSKFIVKAKSAVDIPGWFITKSHSKAFEIGGYLESVAAQKGVQASSGKVGTITAVFQASWEVGGRPPADEPSGNPKGGKATKEGRDITKEYQQVTRDFGVVRSTVSVRYDR
ncbi:MAG TPA: hypothetical protein PKA76_09975 [Pirellulaceae bacterium]|nr:hypothetical protein [Pirellulaceae bacterium]HMP69668.1 hypothetical protein [Pirellulaceae bacterium]